MTLEQLFAGRNIDIDAAQRQMTERMRREGLPYGPRTMTYNSRLAQELACWAVPQTNGAVIHDALFRAYFVNNVNLADVEQLVAIAGRLGFSERSARTVLEQRTMREEVDRDWQRSRELGITGVPTFVCNGRGTVGAQPLDVLEKLLEEAGARRRRESGEP